MKHFLTTAVFLLILIFAGCDSPVDPSVENTSQTLYIMNGSAENLSKISLDDSTIVEDIVSTGTVPNRVRIYDNRIYIVSSGDDNIKVVDPKKDKEILQIIALSAGDNPWDIAFASKTKAYVSNLKTNTVAVIDLSAGTVTKRIDVGQSPEGMIYKNGKLYVANTGYAGWGQPYAESSVSVINTSTDKVEKTIPTFINSQDLAFNKDGKLHVLSTGDYVTNFGKIAIVDVSSATVTDSVILGGSPGDIAITKDGIGYCCAWGDGTTGFLYSYNASTKAVLNGGNNSINIGPNVMQIEYDQKENVLWIPYMVEWAGDGFIQKFDVKTNTVIWISDVVGNGTSAIAIYNYKK